MHRMLRQLGVLLAFALAFVWGSAAESATQTMSPTSCTNVTGIGTVAWGSPGNALANDTSYATASLNDFQVSNYLECVGYGFTIPAGSTINGITVSVERMATNTGIQDAAMRLVKAGAIQATDRSTATAYPTSSAYEDHGGAADLWGTTWSSTDINNANFGAALAAQKPGSSGGARTVSVDHIQITVDYTPPSATVINTYYPGTANVAVSATSITLGAAIGAATPIAAGDLLLIMQMQDATVNANNNDGYGDGTTGDLVGSGATSIGKSGSFEYAVAANAVPIGGGTLNLTCGTANAYTNAAYVAGTSGQKKFQVIRVPVYANYTLGAITAQAWNGSAGGVLAFDVTGTLTLNSATVGVDGLGFRGGATATLTGGAGTYTDYRTLATNNANGSKGEGIAGTPRYVFTAPGTLTDTGVEGYPNGSRARGAPANAGGGATDRNPAANDQNPGGGGGGNAGTGGIGGIAWCPTPPFTTTAPYYGCGYAALAVAGINPGGSTGGFGGAAVAGLGATRLTLGGGGGGGTANNVTGSGACAAVNGLCSSGAAGGGIVMIRAGAMTGSATFNARGNNGDSTVGNDGSGGGGAGGAVLISSPSGMGGVTINVSGGTGGSNLIPPLSSGPHGPGGGGGGGYAITSAATAGCNATGGVNGVTYNTGTAFGAYGAMPGSAGTCATGLLANQIPGRAIGGTGGCSAVVSFLIGVSSPASTCGTPGGTPSSPTVTVTAKDGPNGTGNTVTGYTGTVTLTTSTGHGSWSLQTGNGTWNAPNQYVFNTLDNGTASFYLTNAYAEDLTVTAADTAAGVSSASSTVSFRDSVFVITPTDALGSVPVAGRDHAMKVELWRKDPTSGNQCAIDTNYTGAKNLDAWYRADADQPAGAAAPAIGGLTLPASAPASNPASNNLALTFTNGVATFNLSTSDVGKYYLDLRDDTRSYANATDISGESAVLTVRPFALAVSGIKQGSTNNPGGSANNGSRFVTAGDSFEATVGAYRWSAAADADNDGVPDGTATLAQVTANGLTPKYAWPTALSAASPFGPATGTLGTLANGSLSFTNGLANPASLDYPEVGSFTITATASAFLNTAGLNLSGIVFDSAGTQTAGVVGRFYPHHFAVTTSSLSQYCGVGAAAFIYEGQPFNISFRLQAQNKSNGKTSNYGVAGYAPVATGALSLAAENADGGQNWLSGGRLLWTAPALGWTTGQFDSGTIAATFSRNASAEGPFDTWAMGLKLADNTADAVPLLGNMNAATTGACATCDAATLGGAGFTTRMLYGRLLIDNAYGSELLSLPVNITAQYWDSTATPARYVTNTADTCTTTAGNLALAAGGGAAITTTIQNTGVLAAGVGRIRLSKPAPTPTGKGSVVLSSTLSYLPGAGLETFGTYKSQFIYLRELY